MSGWSKMRREWGEHLIEKGLAKKAPAKASAPAPAAEWMSSDEHALQAAVVAWWDGWSMLRGYEPEDLIAIPNGGQRHIAVAVKLKAEGVRAGVPDMLLAIPQRLDAPKLIYPLAGLWIEHKMPGNGPSAAQVLAGIRLARRGYRVIVSFSVEQSKMAIMEYLGKAS